MSELLTKQNSIDIPYKTLKTLIILSIFLMNTEYNAYKLD